MSTAVSTVTLPTGVTLSVARRGDLSGQPLVLIPGPTDSWRSYEPTIEALPPSIGVVAVSPRGHGDSDKPASGYRVPELADDVVALLDELCVDRGALVAHSGSCLVARHVAIEHPDRVSGLVLEASPSTLRGHPALTELVASVLSQLEDPIDPAFVRAFEGDTCSDGVDPGLLDTLVEEARKVPAHVWRAVFEGLLEHDDTDQLGRIAARTLLIWGDADHLVGREVQDELARRMPSARLVVHRGRGHTPRWEDPSRFADDLHRFVEQT